MDLISAIQYAGDANAIVTSSALSGLTGNSANLTMYTNTQKLNLITTVSQEHNDVYQKVHGDLGRAGEAVQAAAYYNARNRDLAASQRALLDSTQFDVNMIQRDSQSAKRQFEINEWTVGNKMDTLFIFQLLFLALCLLVPLVYLNRIGLIPNNTLGLITFILMTVIALTFAVRYQYTSKTRDLRFWNRRRFPQEAAPPSLPTCEAIQSMSQSLGQTIASS